MAVGVHLCVRPGQTRRSAPTWCTRRIAQVGDCGERDWLLDGPTPDGYPYGLVVLDGELAVPCTRNPL